MPAEPKHYEEFDVWDGEHRTEPKSLFGRIRYYAIAVTIKHHGKWRVHQNDADTIFPSDFHAHRIDKPNEKLDLYTGDVYNTHTNQHSYTLTKKQMNVIYDQLSNRDKPFLNEHLDQVNKFTYRN